MPVPVLTPKLGLFPPGEVDPPDFRARKWGTTIESPFAAKRVAIPCTSIHGPRLVRRSRIDAHASFPSSKLPCGKKMGLSAIPLMSVLLANLARETLFTRSGQMRFPSAPHQRTNIQLGIRKQTGLLYKLIFLFSFTLSHALFPGRTLVRSDLPGPTVPPHHQ
jgi:hypothetical protein